LRPIYLGLLAKQNNRTAITKNVAALIKAIFTGMKNANKKEIAVRKTQIIIGPIPRKYFMITF
jgi:hypothetical protein